MEPKGYNGKSRNYNAETFIEQRLLELCSENEKKIKIYFDWQSCKNDYVRRTTTIVYDFQHYSLHDHTHSTSILEGIEMFLGDERIEKLGIGDLWLLLQVAYGHDIGMAIRYDELKGLWEKPEFIEYLEQELSNPDSNAQESILYYKQIHNLIFGKNQMNGIDNDNKIQFENCWPLQVQRSVNVIVGEYLRTNHGKRSEEYIEKYTKGICKDTEYRLFRLVGEVSYAHVTDFEYIFNSLPYEVDGFGKEKMHPQFVAALLRLGDLLDMDNNRFDLYALEHFGELPRISQVHLEKHLAISHLRVTETIIEATGKTESPEVAHVVQGWFNMLEQEVKNITSKWNSIVPSDFGGCIFRECKLCVFLNGNRYSSRNENNFSVDKHKLIQLLIGKEIYDSDLEAFREYIQNAMDATKVKIWLDILNGEYDYYLEEIKKDKADIQPFDFKKDDLLRRAIEIEVKVEEECDEVKFSIRDRGIGIDEECIQAISCIGKGWRGRKKYKKYIASMPKWLCPTGGFGIGMQSGFMLTDKIHILTKCEDQKANHVVLHSPNLGGEITKESYSLNKEGTEIYFRVPVMRLYQIKWIQESFQKYADERKIVSNEQLGGFFDYSRLPHMLTDALTKYIKEIVPNNFIPIRVCCKSSGINELLTGNIYENLESEKILDEKTQVTYIPTKEGAIFWDEKECVYMEINLGIEKRNIPGRYCFKNVIVSHDSKKEDKLLDKTAGYLIDFMGFNTEHCLQIDRNSFLSGFDARKYKFDCIHMFVTKFVEEQRKTVNTARFLSNMAKSLILIDGLYCGYNEDAEKLLNSSDDIAVRYVIKDEQEKCEIKKGFYEIAKLYNSFANKRYPILYSNGTKMDKRMEASEEIPKFTEFEYNEETDRGHEDVRHRPEAFRAFEAGIPIIFKYGNTVYYNKRIHNIVSIEEMVVLMLEDFWSGKPVYRFIIGEESADVIFMIYEEGKDIRSEKELFIDIVKKRRFYLDLPEYDSEYDLLYVEKLPFAPRKEEISGKEKNLILVPFSLSIFGMLQQKNKKISMNDFLKMVQEGSNFRGCVNWVMKFSKYGKNPERKKVEDEYIRLCKKFYHYYYNEGEL